MVHSVSTDYTQVNVYVHSVYKKCQMSANYAPCPLTTYYYILHTYMYTRIRRVYVYVYTRIHVYVRIRTYLRICACFGGRGADEGEGEGRQPDRSLAKQDSLHKQPP